MLHALWIEWRQDTLQTAALLGLSGALKQVEADAHVEFDNLYGPPRKRAPASPQDREERMRIIAALASAG